MTSLFEFLESADLQHYYGGLNNVLQVRSVQQLKYVEESDLLGIGMSKPEARRLQVLYNKAHPQNYASKLKRLLRPASVSSRASMLASEASKENTGQQREFLLPEEGNKDRR